MPQTISLVRGTATVTGNGTNSVTLFTNSASGIATRVIPNQLAVCGASTALSYVSGTLSISGSASETVIGVTALNSTIGTDCLFFIPSQGSGANVSSSVSGVFSVNGYFPVTSFGSRRTNSSSVSSGLDSNILPNSFWIGPSDSLIMRAFFYTNVGKGGNVPSTVTVRYSFTLITES